MTTRSHITTNYPKTLLYPRGPALLALLALTLAPACDDDAPESAADAPAEADPEDDPGALALGDEGPEIAAAAYAYLRRFGYFPNPELAAHYPGWTPVVDVEPEDPELFHPSLAEALANFQEGYGLPVTGQLDAATWALMQQPRCGHPDHYATPSAVRPLADVDVDTLPTADPFAPGDIQIEPTDPSEYNFFPASSTTTDLAYDIAVYSSDSSQAFQIQQMDAAASTWSAVGPVVFTRRFFRDVTFNFMPQVHGDLKNFDATTYSHDSPPNCYANLACNTQVHLNDQSFVWGTGNGSTVQDIQSHFLHQMGHALGLDHSADSNSVMYGIQPPGLVRRTLTPDDIAGLKALYPTYRDQRVYDPLWYLQLNPQLAVALGQDQVTGSNHWVKYGRSEGRRGSPVFDVAYYQQSYADVPKNYMEALWHWRETGLKAGRRSSPAFDVKYYLNYWPELKAAFGTNYGTALVHWLTHGINEGRRASAEFDPAYYLANNPDVANTWGATNYRMALLHWLNYGRNEGRKGAP